MFYEKSVFFIFTKAEVSKKFLIRIHLNQKFLNNFLFAYNKYL